MMLSCIRAGRRDRLTPSPEFGCEAPAMLSGTAHASCSIPLEASSMGAMGARRRLVLPAWAGFVLVVMGVLVFVASYFLLPVIADQCEDACGWLYPTTWQLSLYGLSAWQYE